MIVEEKSPFFSLFSKLKKIIMLPVSCLLLAYFFFFLILLNLYYVELLYFKLEAVFFEGGI